jgi:hypothetical protein
MCNSILKRLNDSHWDRIFGSGKDIQGGRGLDAAYRAAQRSLEEGLLEPLSCWTASGLASEDPPWAQQRKRPKHKFVNKFSKALWHYAEGLFGSY